MLARRAGGSLRVCRPETTLGPAVALFRTVGGTRVADVTDLDRIGIPVAMAVRPNSRSLSVSQGKGPTLAEAKVSALMESIELWHAESTPATVQFASVSDLAAGEIRPVEVALLPRRDRDALRIEQRVLWRPGRTVVSDEPVMIPAEVIDLDYVTNKPYPRLGLAGGSNGLASGNSVAEAVLHGLCEVIERDAESAWWLASEAHQAARRINPRTITDPVAVELLARYEAADVEVALWDLTTDVGVAVVRALAVDRDVRSLVPIPAARGSGCHPDRDVAIIRALTEAAQSRLTAIVGTRDDMEPTGFSSGRRQDIVEELLAALTEQPPQRPVEALPSVDERNIDRLIFDTVSRVRRLGLPEPSMVDLGVPGSWCAVVRLVAPGLAGVPTARTPVGRLACQPA